MTHDRQRYAPVMDESRYDREVKEQLAEALPVLGQAVLKGALAGLHELLGGCANPARQKFLLWLWTEGYDRFGSVTFGTEGSGMRIWLPNDSGGLAVAVEETEVRVDIDPVRVVRGRQAGSSASIESNPWAIAATILTRLERDRAKADRRRDYESQRGLS